MRPEKATIVADVREKLDSSPYLIVAEYTGMTVDHFAELRKRLAETGARLSVVKNTMLRIAIKEAGLPELNGALQGQNAMVTGENDICAAAKVLKTFAAEFKKPTLKAGILDNALLSTEQLQALADLPPREVLQAQLLALLNTPATQLVRVLNEPATSLARVLKAKLDATGGAE